MACKSPRVSLQLPPACSSGESGRHVANSSVGPLHGPPGPAPHRASGPQSMPLKCTPSSRSIRVYPCRLQTAAPPLERELAWQPGPPSPAPSNSQQLSQLPGNRENLSGPWRPGSGEVGGPQTPNLWRRGRMGPLGGPARGPASLNSFLPTTQPLHSALHSP